MISRIVASSGDAQSTSCVNVEPLIVASIHAYRPHEKKDTTMPPSAIERDPVLDHEPLP